jgi:hypothetical protein
MAGGGLGDQHAAVADLDQAACDRNLDAFTGQVGTDTVLLPAEADLARRAHQAAHGPPADQGRRAARRELRRRRRGRPRRLTGREAAQRRHHADALVGTPAVVVGHPVVEGSLGFRQAGEAAPFEELASQRLVEALSSQKRLERRHPTEAGVPLDITDHCGRIEILDERLSAAYCSAAIARLPGRFARPSPKSSCGVQSAKPYCR